MNNTLQLAEQFGLEISPQMKSMMELMEKNNREKDKPVNNKKRSSVDLQKLISENKYLRHQLREIVTILKDLAAALGACQKCWGSEKECDVCSGRGTAGFTAPDLGMFEKLIRPALIKYSINNQQN